MVSIEEVRAARDRLGSQIYTSPCARSESFTRRCGSEVYFKLENLQMTGSFKERGALNKILQLGPEAKERGIITASAGNHAQAVAYRATKAGLRATVVMPRRTPLVKVANTRSYGADVILEGETFHEAYELAKALEAEKNLVFVHPFDDPAVIAGQGTLGLEILEQVPELDTVIAPVGGGGLISGVAVAIKALRPAARVIGVQAERAPAMLASLAEGAPTPVETLDTLADGIAVKHPGKLTFEHVEALVDRLVTVDEAEIANAVLLLLEREKTVAEGAGAAALAALYNEHVPEAKGGKVVVIVSGGNIDVNILSRIIERGLAKDGRLVRLELEVDDEPGTLARLLQTVGDCGANVVEIHHNRAFNNAGLARVIVQITLETRGAQHLKEIRKQLEQAGYRPENTTRGRARWRRSPPASA